MLKDRILDKGDDCMFKNNKNKLLLVSAILLILTSCNIYFENSTSNLTSPTISESISSVSFTSKPSLPSNGVSEENSAITNPPPTYINQNYVLKFEDEFTGDSLNKDVWNIEYGTGSQYGLSGWGNDELEYYQEENVSVENGLLKITAKRENKNGKNYTSGRIQTKHNVFYTYGYFEACILLPTQRAMWPAFWLLPDNEDIYGGWASSGEIDIMEANGKGMDKYTIGNAIHYGGNWPNNQCTSKSSKIPEQGTIDQFHMYGLEWTSEYLAYYIDGEVVYKITNDIYYSDKAKDNPSAPFDVDFYILFNLAVGGNYVGYVQPEDSFSSADMLVDYVRVYQLKE